MDYSWRGKVERNFKKKIAKYKLESEIKLFDAISITKIQSYFNHADILYLSLKNNQTFKKTIPGKLQTYMASGKPILASISGEAFEVIKKANCGLVSEAENIQGLVDNINKFRNFSYEYRKELANNGLKYSEKYFNKKKIFTNLENELINILK